MTVEEVLPEEYSRTIRNPYHVFGSAHFNALNQAKAESVFYLLFKDTKYRLGLIGGKREQTFASPFSAPFGGFSFVHDDVRISAIEEAVGATEVWALDRGMTSLHVTLPPPMYHESFLAKVMNVLYRKQYTVEAMELNFHFDLTTLTETYMQNIWHNARKNLNIALASNLTFQECSTVEEKQLAYSVIQHNRKVRGKPLRMSWEQVMITGTVVQADFFLIKKDDGSPVAAALVFIVAPKIVQVIYWGDNPEHHALKTMNFLSYRLFGFYRDKGFRFVDIGYSTENSVPNYGLCEFKESLGCSIQPKVTYQKKLT